MTLKAYFITAFGREWEMKRSRRGALWEVCRHTHIVCEPGSLELRDWGQVLSVCCYIMYTEFVYKKCIKITHLDLWSQSLKNDLLLYNFKYTGCSSPILIIACEFRFGEFNSLWQGALCESNLYWMWIGHYNTGIIFDFVLKCTSSHYCPLSACVSLYVYCLLPKAIYCSV